MRHPIEIKKNSHHDLWSAIHKQLIGQYTTDPETAGYGIFVVLWFGARETRKPPNGKRPDTAEELEKRLAENLTVSRAHKISIIVLDVTKP